ncbi:MAG: hypothetical protein JEZ06_21435 [Anaerolineaceae bacterium]|nr:hypothetical protein [Anaerolineaceae bacterium]
MIVERVTVAVISEGSRWYTGGYMSIPHKTSERLLSIYLTMGQYPILSQRIHIRMRKYMFSKGITDEKDFESKMLIRSEYRSIHG